MEQHGGLQGPYRHLVPSLKHLKGVSRRFESPLPALPERWFTWDRGWYVDVVANPSASDMGSPNVLASEGVSNRVVLAAAGLSNVVSLFLFFFFFVRRSTRIR